MAVNARIEARGGILVGHDGSPLGAEAVRTALRCRQAFGDRIEVVRAWTLASASAPDMLPADGTTYEDFEAATLAALERDIEPLRTEDAAAALFCSVVHGHAAARLVEASEHVDLIVVGHRGRGGFAGLLLGSVSEQVARHARCDVLLVRGTSEERPEKSR